MEKNLMIELLKKIFKGNSKFYKCQRHYVSVRKNIRREFRKTGKIKVAFLVVFNSVFPARTIFEKMLNDSAFDPVIYVVPNVSGTMKYQIDTLDMAYEELSAEYPDKVFKAYDFDTDTYLDLKDEYSIIFFANPYKDLVHPLHHVENFLTKNVLPVYVSYGFAALKFWEEVIATDFYNYMWMCPVESPANLKHLKKVERIKGKNGVVTGYIKMDKLAQEEVEPRQRKRILICPHHTVYGWKKLNISNFLKYSELFIKLPKLYEDIDFIFRPHPLLFHNLLRYNIWSEAQINEYLSRIQENKNLIYDTSGSYFDKFANSDAMIHDCGSFIGEYLYSEKPCCYMMKSKEETYNGLVPFGQQCMDQYYYAFEEKDIIDFIENVVINENDPKKEQRISFVEKEMKVNYPHAADALISKIKKALRI